MRALVLGGTGFLGVHVVRRLADEGGAGRVLHASRDPDGAPEGVLPSAALGVRLDLEDDGLERSLAELAPDVVFVVAALSRAGTCEDDPARARRVNALGPARVARFGARCGARVVHVSTDLVFGREAPPPSGFDEGHEPAPMSVYGESKAEGESLVLDALPSAIVARLPLLYGESFGRAAGATDALDAALARGERPGLFVDEWRTPLAVDDAAAALVELAGTEARGIVHVAGSDRVSRHELGVLFLGEERADRVRACRREDLDLRPERPEDTSLDASRARSLLATRLRGAREVLADVARG